jgi:hypothetical protein
VESEKVESGQQRAERGAGSGRVQRQAGWRDFRQREPDSERAPWEADSKLARRAESEAVSRKRAKRAAESKKRPTDTSERAAKRLAGVESGAKMARRAGSDATSGEWEAKEQKMGSSKQNAKQTAGSETRQHVVTT